MKTTSIAVAIAATAIVAIWVLRRSEPPPPDADEDARMAAAPTPTPLPSVARSPRARDAAVLKLTLAERARVAERIAAARAQRTTQTATAPSLPAGGAERPALPSDHELVRTTMRGAMREVVPHLARCYEQAGAARPARIRVVAQLVLTGDPDVGTLIDTTGLADGDGAPLEPGFDGCLRDALVSLQLPPLTEGNEVRVTYPFVFETDDDPGPR